MKTIEKTYFMEEVGDKGISSTARSTVLDEVIKAGHEVVREHGKLPLVSEEIISNVTIPLKELLGKIKQSPELNLHLSKAAISGLVRVITRRLLWR